jgi:hypothetical protein
MRSLLISATLTANQAAMLAMTAGIMSAVLFVVVSLINNIKKV